MAVDPIELFYAIGHGLIGEGKYEDAATILRAMVVIAPDDDRAWLGLSCCHEQMDQVEIARQLLAAARVVIPNHARVSIALARLLRLLDERHARTVVLDSVAEALVDSADNELVSAFEAEARAA